MLKKFECISGLKLNKDKTEILCIGKNINDSAIDKGWIREEVNLLGIKLCKTANLTIETNFKNKLENIKNCLSVWKQRDLSLMGRVHIIKTLANSQLVYYWSSILSPPESFF